MNAPCYELAESFAITTRRDRHDNSTCMSRAAHTRRAAPPTPPRLPHVVSQHRRLRRGNATLLYRWGQFPFFTSSLSSDIYNDNDGAISQCSRSPAMRPSITFLIIFFFFVSICHILLCFRRHPLRRPHLHRGLIINYRLSSSSSSSSPQNLADP